MNALLVYDFEFGSRAFLVFFNERELSGGLVPFFAGPIKEIERCRITPIPPQSFRRDSGSCRVGKMLGLGRLIRAHGNAKRKSTNDASSVKERAGSIHRVPKVLPVQRKRARPRPFRIGGRISNCSAAGAPASLHATACGQVTANGQPSGTFTGRLHCPAKTMGAAEDPPLPTLGPVCISVLFFTMPR